MCRVVTILLLACSLPAATVTVSWDPSPDPSVVGYNVYYGGETGMWTNRVSVGPPIMPLFIVPTPPTSVVLSNLTRGVTYYFGVFGVDALGNECGPTPELVYSIPGCWTNLITGFQILTNWGAAMVSTNLFRGPWQSTNWTDTLWITNRSARVYWRGVSSTNFTLTCTGYLPPVSNYQVLIVTGSNLQSSAGLRVWFSEPSPFIQTNPPAFGFFRGDSLPVITSQFYPSP